MNLRTLLAVPAIAVAAPVAATPNYDGALDTSFGAGGLADYASLGRLEPSALLRQADGGLVVVGTTPACNVVCSDRLTSIGARLAADKCKRRLFLAEPGRNDAARRRMSDDGLVDRMSSRRSCMRALSAHRIDAR